MKNRTYINDVVKKTGEQVTLAGWVAARRDHGKLIFLDVRDTTGLIQIVISEKNKEAYKIAGDIRDEWVISVKGPVQKRPEAMSNPDLETGSVEVSAEEIIVLAEAQTLPFPIDTDGYEISEDLRLKYRYLDMRRSRISEILKLKQRYKEEIYKFLTSRSFQYIDTPILTKSTPEGARDFLVPSRAWQGKFYALPQSPQQYKQLLMVAGIEKYFQFARAFRDEDLRQDRLLEFEQLDIEMAFVDEEEVMELTEELVIFISEYVMNKKIQTKPFPRVTYEEAIKKYKSDKPDLRKDKNNPDILAYLWVTDFPMFETHEDGTLTSTHHPFTAIAEKDVEKLGGKTSDILSIKARQYDLVLNGYEIFGGSIREHRAKILSNVFKVLGYSDKEIQERFGHLLEAFSYGVPPHGGIASSDRWFMAMLSERSIREVVAFPTTGTGRTSVMDAPSKVDKKQLEELGIKIIKDPPK